MFRSLGFKFTLIFFCFGFFGSGLSEPQNREPVLPVGIPTTITQPSPILPVGVPTTITQPSPVQPVPEAPKISNTAPDFPGLVQIPSQVILKPAKSRKLWTQSSNAKNSVRLEAKTVLGFHVKIIRVNLLSPNIRVKAILPKHNKGANFDAMVAGSKAIAMLNGGYFNTKSFAPAGDLVINGRYVARGKLRTALAITPDNRAYVWVKPQQPSRSSRLNWSGFETLISSGPYILRRGLVQVTPKGEGYKDAAVWGRAARSAVGLSSERKLFFVSTREKLNLWELSKIMRALKARDAIALDGGSSVGLAWKGKVLIHPKRKIAFSIAIYQ